MDIDCSGSDRLELRDGDSAQSPIISTYCDIDKNIPRSIQTTQANLWLRFVSDFHGVGNGFKISYKALNVSEWSINSGSCGGKFYSKNGIITSPSYPRSYPAAKNCLYFVSLPSDYYVNVTLINMDINCHAAGSDFFEMRDGQYEDSPLMARFCGNGSKTPAIMQTTQNHLWIRWEKEFVHNHLGVGVINYLSLLIGYVFFSRFTSNNFENGKGFQLAYGSTNVSLWTYSFTGSGDTFTTPNGILTSPNYPRKYHDAVYSIDTSFDASFDTLFDYPFGPNDQSVQKYRDRVYAISVKKDSLVLLKIHMFDLYDSNEYNCETAPDRLEVRDGSSEHSPLIGTFCGKSIDESIQSSNRYMWIR